MILHVVADLRDVIEHAVQRARATGRSVPTERLISSAREVPVSVSSLAPHADRAGAAGGLALAGQLRDCAQKSSPKSRTRVGRKRTTACLGQSCLRGFACRVAAFGVCTLEELLPPPTRPTRHKQGLCLQSVEQARPSPFHRSRVGSSTSAALRRRHVGPRAGVVEARWHDQDTRLDISHVRAASPREVALPGNSPNIVLAVGRRAIFMFVCRKPALDIDQHTSWKPTVPSAPRRGLQCWRRSLSLPLFRKLHTRLRLLWARIGARELSDTRADVRPN